MDTSTRAPRSFNISTASCITGRSDLLPMMIPTSGIVVFVAIRYPLFAVCYLLFPTSLPQSGYSLSIVNYQLSRHHLQCLLHFPCHGDGPLTVFINDAHVPHFTERFGEFLAVQMQIYTFHR